MKSNRGWTGIFLLLSLTACNQATVRESQVRILEPDAVLLEEAEPPTIAAPQNRALAQAYLECRAAVSESNADKRAAAAQIKGMKQVLEATKPEEKKPFWKFW